MATEGQPRGWLPIAALVVGVGAAAGTTAPRLLSPPESAEPPRRRAASPATPSADGGATLRPVLRLMGETLGLDAEGTRSDALRSAKVLRRYLEAKPDADATAIAQYRTALGDVLDRLAAGSATQPAENEALVQGIEALSLPLPKLADGSDVANARKQLLAYLRDVESDDRLRDRLERRAAETAVDVDFLIAGIADYVDSNIGWSADQQLEAIQAAMVTGNLTLDRFYLPDWPVDRDAANGLRAHRESPGAVIFRGQRVTDGRSRMLMRVVLLVPETPTSGLHREALRAALRLVTSWNDGSQMPAGIRILGPTFSGSVVSLRRTLDDDPAVQAGREVRIITGSATAGSNRSVLEGGTCHIHFSSTTHTFPQSLRALQQYLGGVHGGWAQGTSMALLHESNTTFGSESINATSDDPDAVATIFPGVRTIPFPLHVSRLRDAAAQASGPAPRDGLSGGLVLPLTVREPVVATDQLPPLSPELTAATMQTTMAAVFQTIRRERFGIVAIVATDERDALYLAREIRRTSPDTQLVFLGGHMLYLHPDYASYTRGALVVSSYPMSGAAANWGVNAASKARRQFHSATSEALYNAALALTDYGDKLVDYGMPMAPVGDGAASGAKTASGPPFWISAIGRGGFVPLTAYPPVADGTLLLQHNAPANGAAAPRAPFTAAALGLIAVFAFGVLWHLGVVLRQVREFFRHPAFVHGAVVVTVGKYWARVRHWGDAAATERARQRYHERYRTSDALREKWIAHLQTQRFNAVQRVFVLPWKPRDLRTTAYLLVHAAFAVLGLVAAWWTLLATRATGTQSRWLVIGEGLLIASAPLLLATTRHTGTPPERPPEAHAQGYVFAAVFMAACLAGFPLLAAALGSTADHSGEAFAAHLNRVLHADRGFALGSLVSPTLPVMILALAGYVWCVWQLRLLSLVGGGYTALFGARLQAAGATAVAKHTASAASGSSSGAQVTGTIEITPGVDDPARATQGSMTEVLLAGELETRPGGDAAMSRWRSGLTRAFDTTLPTRQRLLPLALAAAVVLVAAVPVWTRVHTLEGFAFTRAFRLATLGGLFLAVLALAQTYEQWRQVSAALGRLGRSRLAPAFKAVQAFHLDWRLNLRLPRYDELAVLLAETDALEEWLKQPRPQPNEVPLASERGLRERAARELLNAWTVAPEKDSLAEALRKDRQSEMLRLLNSRTFSRVWLRTQRYLPVLERWYAAEGHLPDKVTTPQAPPDYKTSALTWAASDWIARAQGAVALTQAFVIRDLLSRIVAGLGVACLSFVLLLAAHLFYAFPGRSTLLTIDWFGVGVSGAIAVSILVAMERSVVLSHLWGSDPGRMSFNLEFVKRVALYGALPVLTVISALFPELGDTIFRWLAPARQLAGF